jgi:hypothetical protein
MTYNMFLRRVLPSLLNECPVVELWEQQPQGAGGKEHWALAKSGLSTAFSAP